MNLYIDNEYMLHTSYAEGYTEVEASQYFTNTCPNAIECYRFVPKGTEWKGGTCANDFIQCVYSEKADAYQKQYNEMKDDYNNGYDQAVLDTLDGGGING